MQSEKQGSRAYFKRSRWTPVPFAFKPRHLCITSVGPSRTIYYLNPKRSNEANYLFQH